MKSGIAPLGRVWKARHATRDVVTRRDSLGLRPGLARLQSGHPRRGGCDRALRAHQRSSESFNVVTPVEVSLRVADDNQLDAITFSHGLGRKRESGSTLYGCRSHPATPALSKGWPIVRWIRSLFARRSPGRHPPRCRGTWGCVRSADREPAVDPDRPQTRHGGARCVPGRTGCAAYLHGVSNFLDVLDAQRESMTASGRAWKSLTLRVRCNGHIRHQANISSLGVAPEVTFTGRSPTTHRTEGRAVEVVSQSEPPWQYAALQMEALHRFTWPRRLAVVGVARQSVVVVRPLQVAFTGVSMNMSTSKRNLFATVTMVLAGSLGAGIAQAREVGVQWSVVIGAPAYFQPAPVYVRPIPIYAAPAPIWIQPGQVYAHGAYRLPTRRDYDGDGIPNRYDPLFNPRGDRDGDGIPNRYDRHDRVGWQGR